MELASGVEEENEQNRPCSRLIAMHSTIRAHSETISHPGVSDIQEMERSVWAGVAGTNGLGEPLPAWDKNVMLV